MNKNQQISGDWDNNGTGAAPLCLSVHYVLVWLRSMCVCLCIMSGLSEVPASWCWPPAAIISSDLVWNKYYSQSAAGWEWPVDTHCIVSVNCKLVSVTPGGPGAVCSLSLVSPSGTPADHQITKFWTAAAAAGPGVNDWRWLSVTDWPLGPATGCCICKQSVLLWHRHRTPARRASHWLLLMLERNTDTAHPSQRGRGSNNQNRKYSPAPTFCFVHDFPEPGVGILSEAQAIRGAGKFAWLFLWRNPSWFMSFYFEPPWATLERENRFPREQESVSKCLSWLLLAAPGCSASPGCKDRTQDTGHLSRHLIDVQHQGTRDVHIVSCGDHQTLYPRQYLTRKVRPGPDWRGSRASCAGLKLICCIDPT